MRVDESGDDRCGYRDETVIDGRRGLEGSGWGLAMEARRRLLSVSDKPSRRRARTRKHVLTLLSPLQFRQQSGFQCPRSVAGERSNLHGTNPQFVVVDWRKTQ